MIIASTGVIIFTFFHVFVEQNVDVAVVDVDIGVAMIVIILVVAVISDTAGAATGSTPAAEATALHCL